MKSSMLRLRKPLVAEQGQALVFTILFAAATGVVCLLLFNSGMLANTKTQLQNAADETSVQWCRHAGPGS
ncbi:pilus assembly protein TadG-related protein [Massilia sp. B-10]|nr:pilus assembly protein TadG-related protein [Massilia sp. B-10]